MSDARFENALEKLAAWSEKESGQLASPSKGADTAYAVLLFHGLASELDEAGHSLDDVVRGLVGSDDEISVARLLDICDSLLGRRSRILEGLDQA